MHYQPLPQSFYNRDTQLVAKELLGKLFIRKYKREYIIGRITEVESYVGEHDLACHAAKGKTARNAVMFGDAGHAYVYLIYGMYHCFNIVTEEKNMPTAVLIRSVEPIAGMEIMKKLRNQEELTNLTTGPGKFTQAFNITKENYGVDVTSDAELFVTGDGFVLSEKNIATSARIGVEYAGASALLPWRYYIKDSAFVSKKNKITQNG